jgi:hypothetical protein
VSGVLAGPPAAVHEHAQGWGTTTLPRPDPDCQWLTLAAAAEDKQPFGLKRMDWDNVKDLEVTTDRCVCVRVCVRGCVAAQAVRGVPGCATPPLPPAHTGLTHHANAPHPHPVPH